MCKNSPNASLEEVRCKVCRSLLFKASPSAIGEVETKCTRCKKIRLITLPLKAAVVNIGVAAAQAVVT